MFGNTALLNESCLFGKIAVVEAIYMLLKQTGLRLSDGCCYIFLGGGMFDVNCCTCCLLDPQVVSSIIIIVIAVIIPARQKAKAEWGAEAGRVMQEIDQT